MYIYSLLFKGWKETSSLDDSLERNQNRMPVPYLCGFEAFQITTVTIETQWKDLSCFLTMRQYCSTAVELVRWVACIAKVMRNYSGQGVFVCVKL